MEETKLRFNRKIDKSAFNKFHTDTSYQSVAAPEAEINRFVIMQLT